LPGPGITPTAPAAPDIVCLHVKVWLVSMEPVSETGNTDTRLAGLVLPSDSSKASPSTSTLISPSVGKYLTRYVLVVEVNQFLEGFFPEDQPSWVFVRCCDLRLNQM